jgi:hypothetical protein
VSVRSPTSKGVAKPPTSPSTADGAPCRSDRNRATAVTIAISAVAVPFEIRP